MGTKTLLSLDAAGIDVDASDTVAAQRDIDKCLDIIWNALENSDKLEVDMDWLSVVAFSDEEGPICSRHKDVLTIYQPKIFSIENLRNML